LPLPFSLFREARIHDKAKQQQLNLIIVTELPALSDKQNRLCDFFTVKVPTATTVLLITRMNALLL